MSAVAAAWRVRCARRIGCAGREGSPRQGCGVAPACLHMCVLHADADAAPHEQLCARLLRLGKVILHGRARPVLRLACVAHRVLAQVVAQGSSTGCHTRWADRWRAARAQESGVERRAQCAVGAR
eukprot:scaffold6986_cov66-Phaeocystis_antarctica.AAC.5